MEPPEPVAAPQRRPRSRANILGWSAVGTVVVIAAVAAQTRLLFPPPEPVSPTENAALLASTAYFDALLRDDITAAYALTCTKIHTEYTEAEFDEYQRDRDDISRYELVDVSVTSPDALVETQMFAVDGRTFPQNITLTKESDGWKVCE